VKLGVRHGHELAQDDEGTLPVFPQITLVPSLRGRTITPLPGSKWLRTIRQLLRTP
jgi:hypothetical protein